MTHLTLLIVDSNTPEVNTASRDFTAQDVGDAYASVLQALNPRVHADVIHPYAGQTVPDLSRFDGAVFTGSGVTWNTDAPEATPLHSAMRAVFAAGVRSFGSCNGMQLAASVLGGSSTAGPNGMEVGLAQDISLTPAGRAHPMMQGRRDGYAVPCVHRDEVTRLPEGAVHLAGNAHSQVQAFAYEQGEVSFWGVQYHPEYTPQFVADLARARGLLPDRDAAALAQSPDDPLREQELRNWLASL